MAKEAKEKNPKAFGGDCSRWVFAPSHQQGGSSSSPHSSSHTRPADVEAARESRRRASRRKAEVDKILAFEESQRKDRREKRRIEKKKCEQRARHFVFPSLNSAYLTKEVMKLVKRRISMIERIPRRTITTTQLHYYEAMNVARRSPSKETMNNLFVDFPAKGMKKPMRRFLSGFAF